MANLQILEQSDIFFEFEPDQLARVAALCGEKRFGVGDSIFEEIGLAHKV